MNTSNLAFVVGRDDQPIEGEFNSLFRWWSITKTVLAAAALRLAAFAPQTERGWFLYNQVIRALAIPGLTRRAFGGEIIDKLRLPDYGWPELASIGGRS